LSYTIPSGTAARMERGEIVTDVMPEFLSLVRGDTIVVDNQDSATHRFGPIVVRPGESTTVTFYEPGRYQGVCTVGTHDTVTIDVT
jgi:plastocyanin